jgi:SAM-dependent methyltransferase
MDEAQRRAQSTFNATADYFDAPSNEFWSRYGQRTVNRLQLRAGASVLDVACGPGASALSAAEAVGPTGRVLAVDLAERLLELGRTKAKERGLYNIEFRNGEMTSLGLPSESLDAVICVFGIFFVPDMESLVAELWRMIRPGGQLAVTTWGPEIFEPMESAFHEAVGLERPDLVSDFRPWDRITDVSAVEKLLADGGATNIDVVAEEGQQLLTEPESWWSVVLGSGGRSDIEAMGPEAADRVREHNLEYIRVNEITAIATNVIYGTAIKDNE